MLCQKALGYVLTTGTACGFNFYNFSKFSKF